MSLEGQTGRGLPLGLRRRLRVSASADLPSPSRTICFLTTDWCSSFEYGILQEVALPAGAWSWREFASGWCCASCIFNSFYALYFMDILDLDIDDCSSKLKERNQWTSDPLHYRAILNTGSSRRSYCKSGERAKVAEVLDNKRSFSSRSAFC